MSTRSRTLIGLVIGAVCGFSAALASNASADGPVQPVRAAQSAGALPWEEARLLAEVFERIRREYVDDVDDRELLENAVRGMVSALDPHSTFLDKEQFDEIRLSTSGSYPGVGIEVAAEGSAVKVLRPIEGSPADRAGLLAGDRILSIDGIDVGSDLQGAIARMRGKAGTAVKRTLHRPSTGEQLAFTLLREHVEVRSVQQRTLEPGYGYVRITGFNDSTSEDLERAIARLRDDNPDGLHGLILDLRNNPGGVLESGVAVADAFLEDGLIVSADGRTRSARFSMSATPGDLLEGADLVLLVNAGSASASEIVAGALKDHGRAALVGYKTYGKGTVQTVMPLSRGGAVKLTTSRYYTPAGSSIHGKGIMPDILAAGPDKAPADLGPSTAAPLTERDPIVKLGLDALKSEEHLAQVAATP